MGVPQWLVQLTTCQGCLFSYLKSMEKMEFGFQMRYPESQQLLYDKPETLYTEGGDQPPAWNPPQATFLLYSWPG